MLCELGLQLGLGYWQLLNLVFILAAYAGILRLYFLDLVVLGHQSIDLVFMLDFPYNARKVGFFLYLRRFQSFFKLNAVF